MVDYIAMEGKPDANPEEVTMEVERQQEKGKGPRRARKPKAPSGPTKRRTRAVQESEPLSKEFITSEDEESNSPEDVEM
jgi:hypothetical protein